MDTAKIRLSAEEEALVCRTDWILTKNRVLEKIKIMLASLQTQQQHRFDQFQHRFPQEINTTPKISKGENYKGLPYLILDYPRFFNREDVFAIRSFFWWGNFFSTTLQLSGTYKTEFEKQIIDSFEELQTRDFYTCINADPWEHHFDPDNYLSLNDLNKKGFEALIRQGSFIKLSKKLPVEQSNDAEKKLAQNFDQLITMLVAG
ncbi:hypothetical protein [Terrimonas alba]|jgi:hypothetical protein|uniref:hypothetical protein n=1 Tax=Terrimonas alba TaxID=3349636 RepID=UPI0035F357BA